MPTKKLSAKEQMHQMRVWLTPISLLIVAVVTPLAIWVVLEIVKLVQAPVVWISQQWSEQPAQLIAFPIELFAAIFTVVALYRILPDSPHALSGMGIKHSSYELIRHLFDYFALLVLFVPLFLLLALDGWWWDIAFLGFIAASVFSLVGYLSIVGAKFHARRFMSKIGAPILALITPGAGAISKIWDIEMVEVFVRFWDDAAELIGRIS